MELGKFISVASRNGEIGFDGLRVLTNYGEALLYSGSGGVDKERVFCAFIENPGAECVYDIGDGSLVILNDIENPILCIGEVSWTE